MSAKIIQFNKAQEPVEPKVEPIKCSFCSMPSLTVLSSNDNTAHICPKCMVKCDNLMKEYIDE